MKFTVAVAYLFTGWSIAACGSSVKDTAQVDQWAVSRCVLASLPESFNREDEHSRIEGSELGAVEIEKFVELLPQELASSLRSVATHQWRTQKAFDKFRTHRVGTMPDKFLDDLAINLAGRFNLRSCGRRDEVEITVLAIIGDFVHRRFRSNSRYAAMRADPIFGPNRPAKLIILSSGAYLIGYSNSDAVFLSEHQ